MIYYVSDIAYSDELCHHGIKGMRRGIRRTPEQLGHPRKPPRSGMPGSKSEILEFSSGDHHKRRNPKKAVQRGSKYVTNVINDYSSASDERKILLTSNGKDYVEKGRRPPRKPPRKPPRRPHRHQPRPQLISR